MRAAIAQDWLADLSEFHETLVAESCQEWRRAESRRPTIADIRRICMDGSRMRGPSEPPPVFPERAERSERQIQIADNARYAEAAASREAWARSHGVASFKDAMAIGLVAVSKMPLVDGAQ